MKNPGQEMLLVEEKVPGRVCITNYDPWWTLEMTPKGIHHS